MDKHPKPLQLALLQLPISSEGRKALNPQIKQISLFWKHRGCLGWGGGVGTSVGLDNGGNSAKNLPQTNE